MVKNEVIYNNITRYKNVKEIFKNTVEKYADNIAFIVKHKEKKNVTYQKITFKEFSDDINNLGTALINTELKDKKIAIIGKNRYEWCLSYLSILNGAGVVVPLDKGLPENEIESSLIRSGAEAIIFEDTYIDMIENIKSRNKTDVKKYICMNKKFDDADYLYDYIEKGKELIKKDSSYIDVKIDEKETKVLVYTSGTTSLSKAVMLSHENLASNIYGLNTIVKVGPEDVSLAFLPMHHTFGATGFLFFMTNGVKTAFCDGLRHIQENLKEYKVSIFVCVPLLIEAMYKKINNQIEKQGKAKIIQKAKKISNFLLKFGIDIRRKIFKQVIDAMGGNIRLAVSGAAGIDTEVVKGFMEYGIRTIQGYGLTETSPVITAENDKHLKYGSVGFALPEVQVEIDEPNDKGIGEVIVKGPNVMQGYYNNEEATKEVLIDGWFHTGDLGYVDKQGYLFITGRKKNVIVLKNGKNVYPEELELLINNLPYVVESMVFGYPKDDDLMLSVKIVYNEDYFEKGKTEQEIYDIIWNNIKEMNSGMTNYKKIKNLIITTEPMEKTTTQKIKRFKEIEKIMSEK